MTEQEVINEITTPLKWYMPHYTSSAAYNIIKRWKEKRITVGKLHEFFNTFGYYKATDDHWYKVDYV